MILRRVNDLCPTIVIIIVVVLLAVAIIYNSDRNQREIIETVRQTIRDRAESARESQTQQP